MHMIAKLQRALQASPKWNKDWNESGYVACQLVMAMRSLEDVPEQQLQAKAEEAVARMITIVQIFALKHNVPLGRLDSIVPFRQLAFADRLQQMHSMW